MAAAFPVSITASHQLVLQDSYGETPETNVTAFKPEVGPPKLRRRTSISQDLIGCKLWLLGTEWQALKDFYRNTLLDGTQQFSWIHPRTKGTGVFQFEGDPPKVTSTFGRTFEVQFVMRLISGGAYPPSWQFNVASNSFFIGWF